MSLRGDKVLADSRAGPGAVQECPLPTLQQLPLSCSLADLGLRGNLHTEVKQLLVLSCCRCPGLALVPKKAPCIPSLHPPQLPLPSPYKFSPPLTASGTCHRLMISSGKSCHLMDGDLPHQAHPGAATATSEVSSMFKPSTAPRRVGAQHLVRSTRSSWGHMFPGQASPTPERSAIQFPHSKCLAAWI